MSYLTQCLYSNGFNEKLFYSHFRSGVLAQLTGTFVEVKDAQETFN